MLDVRESAKFLRLCQVNTGEIAGTECPWELNAGMEAREDYHDTLEALYVWSLPENINDNREFISNALRYIKYRFKVFQESIEPIKSYDAAYMVFSLGGYRKNSHDNSVNNMIQYAEKYLENYFIGKPDRNLRDYSNPYWKAGLYGTYLIMSGKPINFLRKWIEEDPYLISPLKEINNEGPGYMFHHDFISMYGAKLYAIGTLKANFDFDNFASTIPFGFTKRKFDEVAFNSIVMTGLVSILPQLSGSVRENTIKTIKNIENEIDSRVEGGGLRRGGNYFHLRESWPTFFYTYASQLFATYNSLQ